MIHTSRQLKDLIRNFSKKTETNPQLLLRVYMMERLLERISKSQYKNHFILKGGMFVSSIIGLASRSTMDMDATIRGLSLDIKTIENVFQEMLSIPTDDHIEFQINKIYEIMDAMEYQGIRMDMVAKFDRMIIPMKVDLSAGDVITPSEILYSYSTLFGHQQLEVWSYNLETILAEKIETIIARGITNTRMRDFYDVHLLYTTRKEQINTDIFKLALKNTADNRGTLHLFSEVEAILARIENNPNLQKYWSQYQIKFHYASEINWQEVIDSIVELIKIAVVQK